VTNICTATTWFYSLPTDQLLYYSAQSWISAVNIMVSNIRNSVLILPDSRTICLMERFEQKSYSLRMLYLYALYLVSRGYKFWTIWWWTKGLVHVKIIDLLAVRFLRWLGWHSGVLTPLHIWFPQNHWSRENIVKGNNYNPSCCKKYLCRSRGSNWWHRARWVSVMT
jgi:hypothetical protein